jgi:hypothetical protein
MAATVADAAVAAATAAAVQAAKGLKGKKRSRKGDVAMAMATAAAAEAATAAVAAAVAKGNAVTVLPTLSAAGSAVRVWQFWTEGMNGSPPWRELEQTGYKWREGERRQWNKLKMVIDEVEYSALQWRTTPTTAAARLDQQLKDRQCTFANWVKVELPQVRAARAADPAATGQQAAATAAANAAAAAHVAAAAATSAAAAAAAAVPPGAN